MRIVLDTNVLVSGLLNAKGNPAKIVTLILTGALQICHDQRILAEYTEVLSRPRFKFDPNRVRDVLAKIQADGLSGNGTNVALGLPDPDDEPFIDIALEMHAEYLVTGNLSDYPSACCRGMKVLNPADFLAIWQKRPAAS